MPEMRTEVQLGGTWTDITHRVYDRDPVEISAGRRDWGTRTDPSKLSLTLNNRDGSFSPRNPMSPYYGQLTRNTPIRMSVPGADSYLALTGDPGTVASTPDVAALGITGDIDVRAEAEIDWADTAANQTLIGQWGVDGDRAWVLRVFDGFLVFNWTATGLFANQFFVSTFLPQLPRRAAVRATLDVDDGAGGFIASLYWSYSLDGPWVTLISATGTGSTSIYDSTAPLEIAPSATDTTPNRLPFTGYGHRFEVRDGVDGTVIAAPDFRGLPAGTTAWTDSAGLGWTAPPGTVQDRDYVFHGEVASWPTRWDTSGSDVYVPLQAAGIQRRLKQGRKALESTLRRRIPAGGPLAYWPMEDGETATVCYSPTDGVTPLTFKGLDLAADDSLGGSAALPTLGNPATITATVPSTSVSGWQTELVYLLPQMPGAETQILRIVVAGSVCRYATVYASTTGIKIEARDSDDQVIGFAVYSDAGALADFWGNWNRLALYVSDEGGGQTRLTARWRNITTGSYWYSTTLYTGAMGRVATVTGTFGAATDGMALGHLAVFDQAGIGTDPGSDIYDGADDGYAAESALTRLHRLANEESGTVALTWYDGDFTLDSERLGPQKPGVLLDLLYQCAEADGGILYEDRRRLALIYRDRSTLYNQAPAMALDYASSGGGIVSQLDPVDDDQAVRNDITITRDGGSSGRAVDETSALSVLPPPDGVGRYDEEVTLSLANDAQPEPIAHWRLHLGTWDEARYPQIRLRLHAAPHLVKDWLRLRIGDRITITNPPPWLPPDTIDLIVQGYEQRLTLTTWDVTLTCTPAGPWTVGVVEDEVLGRVDTDGSMLSAPATAADTQLAVVPSVAPWLGWTLDPAELPWDVRVGGEVMTVTDVAGDTAVDLFGRTVANGWGTATSGQAWATSGGTADDYSVASGVGTHEVDSLSVNRFSLMTPGAEAEVSLAVSVSTPVLATGTQGHQAYLIARYQDGSNYYGCRVEFRPDQSVLLTLIKVVGGVPAAFPAVDTGLTHQAGVPVRLRMEVQGTTLRARAWLASGAEPTMWQTTQADSGLAAAGQVGVRTRILTGNTNTLPVDFAFTDFHVAQLLTVTRSVNGIAKDHAAGSDVRLATPTIVAL